MSRTLGAKDRQPRRRPAFTTTRRALVAIRHGGATVEDIVVITGRPKQAVYMGLRSLIRDGLVRRPRRAWYERTGDSA